MALNFSTLVLLPCFDLFARPIIVNPIGSQPGQPPYSQRSDDASLPCRGIFETIEIDVIGLDGMIQSDQKTVLDVREVEFAVVPKQLDQITILGENDIPPLGDWEVMDADHDGEGCTTLTIRRVMPASLPPMGRERW